MIIENSVYKSACICIANLLCKLWLIRGSISCRIDNASIYTWKKNNIQYSTIIFAWVHVLYNTHAENTLNLKKKKKVYMYIYKFLDNCDKKVEILGNRTHHRKIKLTSAFPLGHALDIYMYMYYKVSPRYA